MNDQAQQLRQRMENDTVPTARTIAVISGKGGVGKTNISVNFALTLQKKGRRVLLIDLDIGMGNVDILLGVTPAYSFPDLFRRGLSVRDIIEEGPAGLGYISGGSGLSDIFHMDEGDFGFFQDQFRQLLEVYEYIILDMGAGATEESLAFIRSADEAVLVTTPEPTAMTDGYAMIKHVVQRAPDLPISVLVNRVLDAREGRETMDKLKTVAMRFLKKELNETGLLPDDSAVLRAVRRQRPFVLDSQGSKAGTMMKHIVGNYLNEKQPERTGKFLYKLKNLMFARGKR
ncbi:MinD/ParA family protein [Bacillus sp. SB49]|uniref:MinD/ParA family protein n=1 Tax=Bacillaceae TaxID=186817 RepID=UPI0002A4D645|nr:MULTISPECIES: MinD/ParA family protein [Bacillaceae]ELK44762.1 hypothetical protein D479_17794 [Halobacillus sp. BAB-2008]QHT46674.1 MinD/ParA family protein [Bacillus sp. SB49]